MKTLFAMICGLLTLTAAAQTTDGNFHLDKEYGMNLSGTVNLRVSDAKVYITGSSRATAHVKIDREIVVKGMYFGKQEFSIEVNNDDGNLTIKEHSNSSYAGIVGYYSEKYSVNLEIPLGASLEVHGDDGHYYVKNVNGAISIDLDDADIDVTQCKGDNFKFKVDDGHIRMDEGKGTLQIDGDDADVKIDRGHFTKIDSDIKDGDFILETALTDNSDYNIRVQDGLVDIRITQGGGNFNLRHDDGRIMSQGSFRLIEKSDNNEKYSLGKGTGKVYIKGDDARIKLSSDI